MTPTRPGRWQAYRQVFVSRRMAAMLALGFASGLPLALSAGTLQAWLTVEGVDIRTIGYFALVGLPYTFKFVWAPLMDRFEPPLAGRRRGWLVLTQLGLAATCVLLAFASPAQSIGWMGALAVALAFLSASQDIVFDAYRADLLAPNERGAGAALSVLGYRLAMLVSGGLALIVADQWLGWPATYGAMAVLFGVAVIVTLASPRLRPVGLGGGATRDANNGAAAQDTASARPDATSGATATAATAAAAEWRGFAAMLAAALATWFVLTESVPAGWRADRWGALAVDSIGLVAAASAALWAARRVGFPSFLAPWDAFFSRERAWALLAMIVLYKLGDAFAGTLSTAFLIRGAGFTATEVGTVNKVLGLIATIVGALAGGAWLARQSLYRALMLFGLLQAVSNFGYWVLAVTPRNYASMAVAIGFENLCGGMGTAAFVAFLMALTDARFSAAQYALLSALAAVGRVYVGPASGVLVEALGWPTFFVFTVAAAVPGLVLLRWLAPQVRALDAPRRPVPVD